MQSATRAALNREYSPSSLVASIDAELLVLAERSSQALSSYDVVRDIRYGDHPDQSLHLFPPSKIDAPLLVFFHGGYWIELSKEESCFAAPGVLHAGGGFVAVDYSLAPGASLDTMVAQCRQVIVWLYRHAAEYGLDPRRIHVAGHSAGAHLAAMLLSTPWTERFGVPDDVLAGLTLLSGIFDLEPITRTYVNESLGLDETAALRNSPMFLGKVGNPPLLVAHAQAETSAFIRQSQDFAARCRALGLTCDQLLVAGRNHFDVAFDLTDPNRSLGGAVFSQMGLNR